MEKQDKIYVAGHQGMLGKYLVEQLKEKGYKNIVARNSGELNLTERSAVEAFFQEERPEYVFLAAAKTGGVGKQAEDPVGFFSVNMQIEMNVLECARAYGVKKLVFVGASCVYPESEGRVVPEEKFQSGWVQGATESYGLAKAAGVKLCEFYNRQYGTKFVAALPVNLYGKMEKPGEATSVLPSLCLRTKTALEKGENSVVIWGDGTAGREFLHARDCADALIVIMESGLADGWINIGTGSIVTISELAALIARVLDYPGKIVHDLTKPGGAKRSVLDISKLQELGWKPKISLEEGVRELIRGLP